MNILIFGTLFFFFVCAKLLIHLKKSSIVIHYLAKLFNVTEIAIANAIKSYGEKNGDILLIFRKLEIESTMCNHIQL